MLKRTDVGYPACHTGERMLVWEKKLIEWCFKFPEEEVCGIYFKAMMDTDIRNRMRRGC